MGLYFLFFLVFEVLFLVLEINNSKNMYVSVLRIIFLFDNVFRGDITLCK